MTTPITPPSTQSPIATSIAAGAQALIDNAQRLGISWTLSLATVTQQDGTNAPTAILDGDTVDLSMTSMIGRVFPGQRVFVLGVPPSGNYICGTLNLPSSTLSILADIPAVTTSLLTIPVPAGIRRLRLMWSAALSSGQGTTNELMHFLVPTAASYSYSFFNIVGTPGGGSGTGTALAGAPIGGINFPTTPAGHLVYGVGTAEFNVSNGVNFTSNSVTLDNVNFANVTNVIQGIVVYNNATKTGMTSLSLKTTTGLTFSGTFRLEGWF